MYSESSGQSLCLAEASSCWVAFSLLFTPVDVIVVVILQRCKVHRVVHTLLDGINNIPPGCICPFIMAPVHVSGALGCS